MADYEKVFPSCSEKRSWPATYIIIRSVHRSFWEKASCGFLTSTELSELNWGSASEPQSLPPPAANKGPVQLSAGPSWDGSRRSRESASGLQSDRVRPCPLNYKNHAWIFVHLTPLHPLQPWQLKHPHPDFVYPQILSPILFQTRKNRKISQLCSWLGSDSSVSLGLLKVGSSPGPHSPRVHPRQLILIISYTNDYF